LQRHGWAAVGSTLEGPQHAAWWLQQDLAVSAVALCWQHGEDWLSQRQTFMPQQPHSPGMSARIGDAGTAIVSKATKKRNIRSGDSSGEI